MLKTNMANLNDTSITSIQYQVYSPYTSSFNNQDEIRIAIQSQNAYLIPHESSIYLEGAIEVLGDDAAPTNITTTPNCAAFLFDSIRYELNGVEVDKCRNVGISTLMKGLASLNRDEVRALSTSTFGISATARASKFSLILPLRMLLGFAEDYKSMILNLKHELILQRTRNDINCFTGATDAFKLSISKVQWRMPHVKLDDHTQLKIMKQIERDEPIEMAFRSWDLHEYPLLPTSAKQVWSVKTSSSLTRPRYVILGFQTNRKNVITRSAASFDPCGITDVKLYLNANQYPQESMNLDFAGGRAAILYEMYTKFQESYYHDGSKVVSSPYQSFQEFLESPIFIFDCSRQDEAVKTSSVDVKIEVTASDNIPANTAAYCLIIHDNIVKYRPLTNIVTRNI